MQSGRVVGINFEEMDLDYAVAVANRAMRFMTQHGVDPQPANFKVWF